MGGQGFQVEAETHIFSFSPPPPGYVSLSGVCFLSPKLTAQGTSSPLWGRQTGGLGTAGLRHRRDGKEQSWPRQAMPKAGHYWVLAGVRPKSSEGPAGCLPNPDNVVQIDKTQLTPPPGPAAL